MQMSVADYCMIKTDVLKKYFWVNKGCSVIILEVNNTLMYALKSYWLSGFCFVQTEQASKRINQPAGKIGVTAHLCQT